jgi:hypothetical protein
MYVMVGGGLLIIALLGLSLCERGFNPDRGTFESVWPLSHHGVDYEIEIEETWEFRNEVRLPTYYSYEILPMTWKEMWSLIEGKPLFLED